MTAWSLPMKRSEMISDLEAGFAFGLLNGKTPHRRNALPLYIVTAYWQWAACAISINYVDGARAERRGNNRAPAQANSPRTKVES